MDRLEELFAQLRPAAPTGPVEYLVVGLGNPGKEYERTRHNAGWQALDYITESESIDMKRVRFQSFSGEGSLGGHRILFLKPTTFMNNSGQAVREAMEYYHIPIQQVIVLCDDIALDPGVLRIRRKGSDGGQKGLRSIIQHTGSQEFPRLRIGVGGKPHPEMDLAAWVLSRFTPKEEKELETVFRHCKQAIEHIVQGEIEQAMADFN